MSDNWQTVFASVSGLNGTDGGSSSRELQLASEQDLYAEWPRMPDAPGVGKLRLAVFGEYEPTLLNEAQWSDEGQPTEVWDADEAMVNMGPHRLVLTGQPVTIDLAFHGARRGQWRELASYDGPITPIIYNDEGRIITPLRWSWEGEDPTPGGLAETHTYATAGLYTVSVDTTAGTGTRWIRVVDDLDDLPIKVIEVGGLSGSLDSGGWIAQLTLIGDVTAITPFTQLGLFVDDELDLGWHDVYRARMDALAVRRMFNSDPPPDPNYKVDEKGNPLGEPPPDETTWAGTLTGGEGMVTIGGDWAEVDRWDPHVLGGANASTVPANLVKAIMRYFSNGKANWTGDTGNATCGLRRGLMGIHDCFFTGIKGTNPFDPTVNLLLACRELRTWYNTCGFQWWKALNGYLFLSCAPDGSFDIYGQEDWAELHQIMDWWAELDAAMPTGAVAIAYSAREDVPWESALPAGPVDPIPVVFPSRTGNCLLLGTATEVTTLEDDSPEDVHQITMAGAQNTFELIQRKVENFWEDLAASTNGGTFPSNGSAPLRVPDMIYHVVSHHTDWATKFDMRLDFTSPRSSSSTLSEGPLMGGFQAWAHGDFAEVFVGKEGDLRYKTQPSMIGQAWWDEAYTYAPVLAPSQIARLTVTERNLNQRVSWVKLGGYGKNACAQFGEHPCGGPPVGSGGRWIFDQGLWYDDAHVLCDFAAHVHAFENRNFDVSIELPWRHDLELGDLIRLPLLDLSGRFDWRVYPRLFEITQISHSLSTGGAWMTTLSCQQVTYGLPCFCPRARCPDTVFPDPPNNPPGPPFPGGPNAPGGPNIPGGWPPDVIPPAPIIEDPKIPGGGSKNAKIKTTVHGRVRYTSCGNGKFFEAWTDDVSEEPNEFYSEKSKGYLDWGDVTQTTCLVLTVKGSGYQPVSILTRAGTVTLGTDGLGDHTHYLHRSLAGTEAEFRVMRILPVTDLADYLARHPSTPITTDDGSGGPDPLGLLAAADLPEGIDGVEPGDIGEVPLTPEGYPVLGVIAGTKALPYLGRYGHGMPEEGATFWQSPLEAPTSQLVFTHTVTDDEANAVPIAIGDGITGDGTGGPDPDGQTANPIPPALDPHTPPGVFSKQKDAFDDLLGEDPTQWTPQTFYLSADKAGRTYLMGFVPTTPGKTRGSADLVTLSPKATSVAQTEPQVNERGQPYQQFQTSVIRVDYKLLLGSATYDPVRGDAFGGDGADGPGDPSFGQANWPTAEAIDVRISAAEQANQRSSKLHGAGVNFMAIGAHVGVNPGLMAAVAYVGSLLGADGSQLAVLFNNFAQLPAPGSAGTATLGFGPEGPRAAYGSPTDGVQAIADAMDAVQPGTVTDVLEALGMPSASGLVGLFGEALGIDLSADVDPFVAPDGPPAGAPSGPGSGPYATMLENSLRQHGGRLTQGPYQEPTHTIIDAYDIAVPTGTPLYPLVGGSVTTGFDDIYGNWIDITSDSGVIRFGHLQSYTVTDGDVVQQNTLVGYSDNTGSSTGPHLHIELRFASGLAQIMAAVGFNLAAFQS